MKNAAAYIFILLMPVINISAQNETGSINTPADSVLRYQGIVLPPDLNYDFENMMFMPKIDPFKSNQFSLKDTSTIWLMTELSLSNSVSINNSSANYFTEPLYRQYQENSKFSIVNYVLGAAQLGAVGYLAYKHIKKYGFLK